MSALTGKTPAEDAPQQKGRASTVLNVVAGQTLHDEIDEVREKKAALIAKVKELNAIEAELLLIHQMTRVPLCD